MPAELMQHYRTRIEESRHVVWELLLPDKRHFIRSYRIS